VLKKGDIVIYESTVYPGATEEDCVPVLEKFSGLKFNVDFYAGYSPERINPGDKEHRVSTIKKVTSGSTPEVAELVDQLYRQIITAGTHKASSIKVAEAAKVIENTQRDLNIALMNELALIFNKPGHRHPGRARGRRHQVELPALPPRPGRRPLHRRRPLLPHPQGPEIAIGYHPEVILAGRRINDGMGAYVAAEVVKLMLARHHRRKAPRAGAGPHLQGKLPRPAQHPRGRHHRELRRLQHRRWTCTTPGSTWPRPSTNTSRLAALLRGRGDVFCRSAARREYGPNATTSQPQSNYIAPRRTPNRPNLKPPPATSSAR
jgi:hypothetical protein